MGEDVVANTTTIIDGFLVWATIKGDPRMIRSLINVELGLGHHFIEVFLKGAVSSWGRLEAYGVGGVPPGPCLS